MKYKLIRNEDRCTECGQCALYFGWFDDELDLSAHDPDYIERVRGLLVCPNGACHFEAING